MASDPNGITATGAWMSRMTPRLTTTPPNCTPETAAACQFSSAMWSNLRTWSWSGESTVVTAAVMVNPITTGVSVRDRDMKAATRMAREPSSAIGTPSRSVSRALRIRSCDRERNSVYLGRDQYELPWDDHTQPEGSEKDRIDATVDIVEQVDRTEPGGEGGERCKRGIGYTSRKPAGAPRASLASCRLVPPHSFRVSVTKSMVSAAAQIGHGMPRLRSVAPNPPNSVVCRLPGCAQLGLLA